MILPGRRIADADGRWSRRTPARSRVRTPAWQAFCDAVGAVRVRDLAEFTDTIELFSAGSARDRGPATAIATVHDSGAERALTADVAHELGVQFADLSARSPSRSIDDLLDDGLIATNPLDVWGTGADTRALFRACLRVIADDPAVAVTALAVDLVTEFDGDTAYADAVLDVAAGHQCAAGGADLGAVGGRPVDRRTAA